METEPVALPEGTEPKYLKLAQVLTTNHIQGVKPHSPLPTERELQAKFEVSRDTVRRAISYLITKGLIYNIQGSGTFVADRKVISKTPRLTSFTEDMQTRGSRPSSKTISCAMTPAPAGIARDLKIEPGTPVLRIIRLRIADGAPMAFERAHFLPESFAHVEPEVSGSLDAQLADNGYRIMKATQKVSATNLNREEADALQLPVGSASLRVQRIGYTLRGLAVESTETLYRADRYDYVFHIERDK